MEETKKIITKAVYGNRIQTFRNIVRVPAREGEMIKDVLGGTVSKAKILSTSIEEDDNRGIRVRVNAEHEIHIWYWSDNDTKVYKVNAESSDIIEIKKQGPENFSHVDVSVWMKEKPVYIDAAVIRENKGDQIAVQLEYTLEAEIIGETLLNVKVFNDNGAVEAANSPEEIADVPAEIINGTAELADRPVEIAARPMELANKLEFKYLQNL